MENNPPAQDDGRSSRRGKFRAKLFGRDRKISDADSLGASEAGLNDFLHGPSEKMPAAIQPTLPSISAPPMLAKLDTSNVSRWPSASDIGTKAQLAGLTNDVQQFLNVQQPTAPETRPRRRNKGLNVRFVDALPEVIGEGGDESEIPPIEIGRRKQAMSVPVPPLHRPVDMVDQGRAYSEMAPRVPSTSSGLRRTKTGYSIRSLVVDREVPAGTPTSSAFLDSPVVSNDEKRRSFIEAHQAEQREAEAMAFAKAARSASTDVPSQSAQSEESTASMKLADSPMARISQPPQPGSPPSPVKNQISQSPSSVYSNISSPPASYATSRQPGKLTERGTASPSASPQKSGFSLHDVVAAASDDALNTFVARTRHLFELFRLQSETMRPLMSCDPTDMARAGLWWFLQGRMALENTIRERPSTPQSEQRLQMARQQAHSDLAKSYWLLEEVYPQVVDAQRTPTSPDALVEVETVRKSLASNLRKLAVSMKRNGFLPPEDLFLPATIDKTIWIEYPPLSQDIVNLLRGNWGSALASLQNQGPCLGILEAMPLGDTTEYFSYGRIPAKVYLMEQGMESQRFSFPCLVSMVRAQNLTDLAFILASQNGTIQLKIQSNKKGGPALEDIQWNSETSALKIQIPRGFGLVLQTTQTDYKLLRTMYEFSYKIHATLYPRKDEHPVFGTILRSFQYFDSDPQSRQFPKEVVANCEVALFERLLREGAATGPRTYHCGYRIAVVTGPKTRTLSGINHVYLPRELLQMGFLRGEQKYPALLLKFADSRTKGSMVLTFNDESERQAIHSHLTGIYQHSDEAVFTDVALVGFSLSQQLGDLEGLKCWRKIQPQRAKIINDESSGDMPPTVLAERLRVVMECGDGSIVTDRVNVAPGELKIRLSVKDQTSLGVLRQPQTDMTVSIPDQQPRDIRAEVAEALKVVQTSPTIRTYRFASPQELYAFQAAITGFTVLFDGVASTFAISRRRMVISIHKKWEAGATRIQVVQQEKVTQLLAFFDDFHHGHCMGFVLKGTDVFESFTRNGKAGLKIDDAKFPLPRIAGEGRQTTPDMAFVCLDLPDLPGEHDDITILFETEADRDRLAACLPAPVKAARLMMKR